MLQSHGCARWTVYVDVTLTRFKLNDKVTGRAFELTTISEAVHADGDDRSPLAGLSG